MEGSGEGMTAREEITTRSVLAEALNDHEAFLSSCSKGGRRLEPVRGYEEDFEREKTKCEILRRLIRSLECDGVRKAMARWQMEEMTGEKQTGLFAPGKIAVYPQEAAEEQMVLREDEDGRAAGDLPDYSEGT